MLLGAKEELSKIMAADILAAQSLAGEVPEPVDSDALQHVQDANSIIDTTQEMGLKELYEKLLLEEDIIVVIDKVDETRVRKGLSSIKAKQNAKFKDSGLPTEDSTIEFKVHEDYKVNGRVKLQIYLKQKATVKVHALIIPDDEEL